VPLLPVNLRFVTAEMFVWRLEKSRGFTAPDRFPEVGKGPRLSYFQGLGALEQSDVT